MEYQNFVFIRHERIKTLKAGSPKHFGALSKWAHQVRAQTTPNADPTKLADNQICCSETGWNLVSLSPKARRFGKKINQEDQPAWLRKSFLADKASKELKRYGIDEDKVRRDATWIEELLLGASADWFRNNRPGGELDATKVRAWVAATVDFLRLTFKEKLLAVVVHYDEMTPHIAAFVLPVVFREQICAPGPAARKGKKAPRSGYQLAASEMFSGGFKVRSRERRGEDQINMCAQNQTHYAKFCQHHGLDLRRGTPNSRTKHRRMQSHYHLTHGPTPTLPDLKIPTPKEAGKFGKKFGEDYSAFVIRYVSRRLEEEQKTLDIYHAKAIEHSQEVNLRRQYENAAADQAERVEALNAELARIRLESFHHKESSSSKIEELKKKLAKAKDACLPITIIQALSALLSHSGIIRGKEARFDCPSGVSLFVDSKAGTFRTGTKDSHSKLTGTLKALELALGRSRDEAINWLLQNFSSAAVGATLATESVPDKPGKDVLPHGAHEVIGKALEPNDSEWQNLKRIFKSKFGLKDDHLEKLHRKGLISANEKGLPLFGKFQAPDLRKQSGCYLATNSHGYLGGLDSNPEMSGFFGIGSEAKEKRLILTDSIVTAILVDAALSGTKQKEGYVCLALPVESDRSLQLLVAAVETFGASAVITLNTPWGIALSNAVTKKKPKIPAFSLKSVDPDSTIFDEAMETEGNCRSVSHKIRDIVTSIINLKDRTQGIQPSQRKSDPNLS